MTIYTPKFDALNNLYHSRQAYEKILYPYLNTCTKQSAFLHLKFFNLQLKNIPS